MNKEVFAKLPIEEKLRYIKSLFDSGDSSCRFTEPIFLRQIGEIEDGEEADEYTYSGVASATAMDRDGLFGINVRGGNLDNYLLNPVILLMHRQDPDNLPIGRAIDVGYQADELRVRFQLDRGYAKAREAKSSIDRGFLRALSIHYVPRFDDYDVVGDSIIFRNWDLVEISVVGAGEDPLALIDTVRTANPPGEDFVMLKSDRMRFVEGSASEQVDNDESEEVVEEVEDEIEISEQVEISIAELKEEVDGLRKIVNEQNEVIEEQRVSIGAYASELEDERQLRKQEITSVTKRLTSLNKRLPNYESAVLDEVVGLGNKFS